VWKKLDMQPFSINTILVLIAGAVTLAAGYYFPNFLKGQGHMYIYTIVDACLRGGIIVAVYLAMLYWLKPSADLREYIASVKKNKRLF
jgi:cytochrome c oxidase subunit IV